MFLVGGGEYYRGDEPGGVGMKNPLKASFKALRTCYWKWRVNRSLRVLDELDWSLKAQGYKRAERRRFWAQLHYSPAARTAILNKMTQGD